ncbi:uncharacterized protein LOC110674157 [Aedes aegypti]|uniref:Uncharacterized protein n=1 Tax=Aedes aegypti TaxID=7159 RepID=A0A6I8TN95_AEDAE|nr:uncharacterized protein LOC110674157 [Aedes aegypti]
MVLSQTITHAKATIEAHVVVGLPYKFLPDVNNMYPGRNFRNLWKEERVQEQSVEFLLNQQRFPHGVRSESGVELNGPVKCYISSSFGLSGRGRVIHPTYIQLRCKQTICGC